MVFALAPGLSFGIHGDRTVVLDLPRDRYLQLSGGAARTLRRLSAQPPLEEQDAPDAPDALAALVAAGIIVRCETNRPASPVALPTASASALEIGPIRDRCTPGAMAVIAAMALVSWSLRRSPFYMAIAHARHQRDRATLTPDPGRAIAIGQAFARHRPWYPRARACVPDALALARLLCRAGVAHDLAFGVRFDPFTAHAWVQTDTHILSDSLDRINDLFAVFRL